MTGGWGSEEDGFLTKMLGGKSSNVAWDRQIRFDARARNLIKENFFSVETC